MKRILLLAALSAYTLIGYSQDPSESGQIQKIEIKHNNVTISNDQISQDDYTLEDYQRKVDEIKLKIQTVKSNPEEDAKAKETGWYDMANEALKRAEHDLESFKTKFSKDAEQEAAYRAKLEQQLTEINSKLDWLNENPKELNIAKTNGEYDAIIEEKKRIENRLAQ